ncbi:MAG: L,D-transpeptidase family protein [Chitinophagaceae bacterium]|nr:L,D-transpeptidase family protein [Chitinophagaceae bacterium]
MFFSERNYLAGITRKWFTGSMSVLCLLLFACQQKPEEPKPVEIVKKPEDLNKKTFENITSILEFASANGGKLNDSVIFTSMPVVKAWYAQKDSLITWSNQKAWLQMADSLFDFIKHSEEYGLFPSNYHYAQLNAIFEKLKKDSSAMLDAALWARADVSFTDAFMQIAKDIKVGRLQRDSITLRKDTLFNDSLGIALLQTVQREKTLTQVLQQLEPNYKGYHEIRSVLKHFLDSMDRKEYTYVNYPFEDSLEYIAQLQKRLFEGGYISFDDHAADTAELRAAVRSFQESKDLKVDGKAGPAVVAELNNTGIEKFRRIAINLDRYKQLPDTMPARYLWVNLPAYKFQLWDNDTLKLESRVIVGNPKTRTPLLTSELTNYVIFPQWTVPYSIVFKEMLPQIQRKVEYLDKQNLMVVDKNDSIIDPHTINWFKLNKNNFSYQLKQREGDDNSLGVIKFNFRNKYSVYLHDTNARGLFSRKVRALSHGCVRVQEWKKLANYLVQNDSIRYKPDTLAAWMKRKEKHMVNFSKRLPIYIRYFTAEAKDGSIVLHDDIYAEDKIARNRYMGNRKPVSTL